MKIKQKQIGVDNFLINLIQSCQSGGEGEIRTHGALADTPVFLPEADPPWADKIKAFPFLKSSAEGVRFELTVPLRAHRISSAAHSTSLPPLRAGF